jgi:hypothetical protein
MVFLTINEIEQAQRDWAERLTAIGNAFIANDDFYSLARLFVGDMYGYREGAVLFKPTKAGDKPFRLTAESALSYFIGGDPEYPEDTGFALHPWRNVRFENAGFILKENHALTMGNYFFTGVKGDELKVEFSMGWFRAGDGRLKINLHHSSLPFCRER